MKRLLKKILCVWIVALCICTSMSIQAFAMETSVSDTGSSTVSPCADVIVFKYRISNGVYQYRRWNQTQGYWVDPEWIDM